MSSCRVRIPALLWVALLILGTIGCAGTQRRIEPERYLDDFGEDLGDDVITLESVSETRMMNRRTHLELRTTGMIPVEDNFKPTAGVGVKGDIELAKNVYVGFSFDWARFRVDEENLKNPVVLLGAGAEQRMDFFDRYEFMGTIDYDVVLEKNFLKDKNPLIFRMGVGNGFVFVDAEANDKPFGADFDIDPFFAYVLRPEVALRWGIWDHGMFTFGTAYDFVPEDNISIKQGSESSTVRGKVNFSSWNIFGGFAFEW